MSNATKDQPDFPVGLQYGGKFDAFKSLYQPDNVAFIFLFEQHQIEEPGILRVYLTREEVARIIERLVCALNQF